MTEYCPCEPASWTHEDADMADGDTYDCCGNCGTEFLTRSMVATYVQSGTVYECQRCHHDNHCSNPETCEECNPADN